MKYQPIDCGDYDMLEIACLDAYTVVVRTADRVVTGVAAGLQTSNSEEFLQLRTAEGTEETVRIDHIRTLTVLTRPARFEQHTFAKRAE